MYLISATHETRQNNGLVMTILDNKVWFFQLTFTVISELVILLPHFLITFKTVWKSMKQTARSEKYEINSMKCKAWNEKNEMNSMEERKT